jgi:hypothetical protein
MVFVNNCTYCSHETEYVLKNNDNSCPCGCHEHIRTLARFKDVSLEQEVKDIKEQREVLAKDPIEYAKARFIHETGISDIWWNEVRKKVADK